MTPASRRSDRACFLATATSARARFLPTAPSARARFLPTATSARARFLATAPSARKRVEPRVSPGPRVRLRAFCGAWAAINFETAAHAPQKAHARPGAPGRSGARATRVTWVACAVAAILLQSPLTATAAGAKAAKPPKAPAQDKAAKPPKAPVQDKAPADIDALLAGLAKAPGLYARFREEKHITLLQQPLVSEGSIYFTPPSRFARHTEKPIKSTMIIDGNRLQFGSTEGSHEEMNLGTNPVARLFADAFVMLLSGNRAGLEKIFKMQLTPEAAGAWKLALTPRVAPMDKLIKEMELRGRGLNLNELDVREANGDWTRTSFTNVDLNRRYTPAEQTKFFTLPKK